MIRPNEERVLTELVALCAKYGITIFADRYNKSLAININNFGTLKDIMSDDYTDIDIDEIDGSGYKLVY